MALGCLWSGAWAPFGAVVAAAVCVAGTWRHRPSLVRLFAWQAWHLATSTVTLRGRCGTYGTYGTGLPLLGPVWSWSPRLFAWQAWQLATSTFTLRGRCGTWRHRPSLCVAGVALGDIDPGRALGPRLAPSPRLFAWQVWHLATWTFTLRGRLWHLSIDHFNMPGLLHRINFGVYLLYPLLRHGICYPVLLLLPISDIDAMSDNHWFTMFI